MILLVVRQVFNGVLSSILEEHFQIRKLIYSGGRIVTLCLFNNVKTFVHFDIHEPEKKKPSHEKISPAHDAWTKITCKKKPI